MTPYSISLYTTFRASHSESVIEIAKSWTSIPGVQIFFILQECDKCYQQHIQDLLEFKVAFAYYISSPPPHLHEVASFPPSLSQVFSLIKQTSNTDLIGFINSDILIGEKLPKLFPSLLRQIFQSNFLLLFNRTDLDLNHNTVGTYKQGFDMFVLSKDCLNTLPLSQLGRFYIGQVGWDYALPIIYPSRKVYIAPEHLIFHYVHPTGSTLEWDERIYDIFNLIPVSHIHHLPGFHRILYHAIKKISQLQLPTRYLMLSKAYKYLLSRLMFYLVIRKLLSPPHCSSCTCDGSPDSYSDY